MWFLIPSLSLDLLVCKVGEQSQMISTSISNPKPWGLMTCTGRTLVSIKHLLCARHCWALSTHANAASLHSRPFRKMLYSHITVEMSRLWEVRQPAGHSDDKGHSQDSRLPIPKYFLSSKDLMKEWVSEQTHSCLVMLGQFLLLQVSMLWS